MPDDHTLSGEEAQELLDPEAQDTLPVFNVPCAIFVEGEPEPFIVHSVKAWSLTRLGFFASGHWANDVKTERDILIAPTRIRYIDLDFKGYDEASDVNQSDPSES